MVDFATGWVSDPGHVKDVIDMRLQRGDNVYASSFADKQKPELRGAWRRLVDKKITGVFLRDREKIVNKGYRRPQFQRSGTCVAQAVMRGCQTSLYVEIADNKTLYLPADLSFAPIYSLARHEIGKDRVGYGDGAILGDAMLAIHDIGVATNDGLFPGLTQVQIEQLAVKYATPGKGTPQEWIKACKGHTCITFWIETLEFIFDCIASGYAVPYAHNYVTSGRVNKYGISDLGDFGPHARCFTGVFLDVNGETQLESSESWGSFPAAGGPKANDDTIPVDDMPTIRLEFAGGIRQLAPGNVGVNAKRFWSQIQSGGEAWAASAPKYPQLSLVDAVKGSSSRV